MAEDTGHHTWVGPRQPPCPGLVMGATAFLGAPAWTPSLLTPRKILMALEQVVLWCRRWFSVTAGSCPGCCRSHRSGPVGRGAASWGENAAPGQPAGCWEGARWQVCLEHSARNPF